MKTPVIAIIDDERDYGESLRDALFAKNIYAVIVPRKNLSSTALSDIRAVAVSLDSYGGDAAAMIADVHPRAPEAALIVYARSVDAPNTATLYSHPFVKAFMATPLTPAPIVEAVAALYLESGIAHIFRANSFLPASAAQLLFDDSAEAMIIINTIDSGATFSIAAINAAARAMSLNTTDIIGKNITRLFPDAELVGLLDRAREVFATGEPASLPQLHIGSDPSTGWMRARIVKLTASHIAIAYCDISHEIIQKDPLCESDALFRELPEGVVVGIVVSESETDRIIYTNPAVRNLLGYSKSQISAKKFVDIFHESCHQMIRDEITNRRLVFGFFDTDIPCITSDGRTIYANLTMTPITISGKKCNICLVRDITEKKLAQKAIWDSIIQYRTTLDSLREFIFILDEDLRVTMINNSFREAIRMLDLDTEIIGRRITDIYPGIPARALDMLRTVFETATPVVMETPYTIKDQHHHFEIQKLPIIEKGKVTQVVIAINDITSRKNAENHILDAHRESELYIDLMTHDLTNYNQSIIGYLDILGMKNPGNQLIATYTDRCKRQIRKAENLISKARAFSAAKLIKSDDIIPIGIDRLVTDAYKTVSAIYKDIPIRLIHTPCGIDVSATELLSSVFFNLFDNAIKHSAADTRVITVTTTLITPSTIEIRIVDNGPGIPAELRDIVFNRFLRVGEKNGQGLGLSLVKTIVERFGGVISVQPADPAIDKFITGSAFIIQLPVYKQ